MANIILIKKEDKALLNNYRQMSITSIVGKLMEIIQRYNLVSKIEGIVIKNTQQNFWMKRSCLINLIDFYNNAFNIYDKIKAIM